VTTMNKRILLMLGALCLVLFLQGTVYAHSDTTYTIHDEQGETVFLLYRVTFTLMPEVPLPFKIGHALTHATFAMTATFGLIAVFQNFFDSSAYLWRRLAANSYIIYFIHQCVVIPIGCLVQKLDINIWLKYTGVSIVTLLLCFLLAEYIIQPVLSLGKNKKSPPLHS
jgi:glucan biosynthesis protein C